MQQNELIERLRSLDRDVYLQKFNDKIKYECYIVGGGAMLLLGLIPRATMDIDVIRCTSKTLIELMPNYDINMNVTAYLGCFADDYCNRAIKLNLDTKVIDFYVLSLEDLVVSKLAAGRTKDLKDIRQPEVIKHLDWKKLEELIDYTMEGLISDYSINELQFFYNEYKRECKL